MSDEILDAMGDAEGAYAGVRHLGRRGARKVLRAALEAAVETDEPPDVLNELEAAEAWFRLVDAAYPATDSET